MYTIFLILLPGWRKLTRLKAKPWQLKWSARYAPQYITFLPQVSVCEKLVLEVVAVVVIDIVGVKYNKPQHNLSFLNVDGQ
jgi:hypothetical protein